MRHSTKPRVSLTQEYCSADYRESHCSECKCRGCSFCGCESKHDGDARFEECADWCSVDFFKAHCGWWAHRPTSPALKFGALHCFSWETNGYVMCGRCSCKGCDFCKTGPPCDSFLPNDSMYETCDSFCSVSAPSLPLSLPPARPPNPQPARPPARHPSLHSLLPLSPPSKRDSRGVYRLSTPLDTASTASAVSVTSV